ncbi:EAL domain-containing protein [Telmatospirillum sp.]|uniref:bifunctional diguanylate cyclase/phosphodiesterase n=1 Tax=Telmatospirillum sp. TaxID=2079197 RepID=UPI00283BACA7|nr:EAL domain-containing protein [Telmatospirillum sp.]MDR3439369.1 EAL domain-containing protein [Telmatospirillum sp.]
MASLLDVSVTEAVGKIDLSLRATVDELEEQLRRHGHLDDLNVNTSLDNRRTWVPRFSSTFRVTDASGAIRYCSGCVSGNEDRRADDDFFVTHRSRNDSGLIVTNLLIDRASGNWVVVFSRRYDGPDGRFAGVISASVPAYSFAQLFAGINLGPRGVAVLRDADMTVIVRSPPALPPSQQIGSRAPSRELMDVVASGENAGFFHLAPAGDGVERTLAYRHLSAVPFHLTAGMATEDYLSEWQLLLRKAIAAGAIFLAGSISMALLLWRAEMANQRSRLLLRNASDGIHILDSRNTVIETSDAFCSMLGYSRNEMIGMKVNEWDVPLAGLTRDEIDGRLGEVTKVMTRETLHRRKDGSCLDVEVTARPLQWAGQKMLFCSARDITERKLTETRNRRLSNLYAALSQCNQAIVHSRDEAELFPKICRCAVEYGFVKTAWIGFVDEFSKEVKPTAWYGDGHDLGFPGSIPVVTVDADDPRGRGLTGTAIRDNRPQWSQDYLHDPITAPWHDFGQKAGWRSSATLPLHRHGVPVGCLVIYSDTVNAFDDDARRLLIEMAMDISFALDNFAREIDRRRSVEALRASETRYSLAFQTSQDAIAINRLSDGTYVDVNEGFIDMSGFSRDDVIGRSSLEINVWASTDDRQNLIERLRHALTCRNVETQFRKKDGTLFWALMSASLIEVDGEPCILSVTRDVSDIKLAEDEIKNLAFYDPLTRLPNRRLLTDRLHHAVAISARNSQKCALLFVDLDDFKTLNDSSGHAIGDLLLQEVAKRLVANVREVDTVARFGGDEFIVLIEDLSESIEEAATQAESIGEKILTAIAQPYLLAGRECRGTASVGIVLFGGQHESSDELLTQADIAMYQAKAAGRNTLRFFSPDLQTAINSRAVMERDLHHAIAKDQFLLHYQPQMDHGELVGAEVLVRWNHPKRGMVAPNEFIPLAEETGLILPLGQWVLETACRQIAAWRTREDTAHIVLAVNVSALQFRQPDFIERTLATLERTGAKPQNLKLELTESMLADNVEDVIAKMASLRSCGVRFSLDDFGTGYSSLAYLKRLPLDQLKIDRSFVTDVLTDANDAAIAQTIVALGQTMGLSVIAEGVETEAQRDFLAGLGCHAFQGYLFGKPMPLNEFEALLRDVAN